MTRPASFPPELVRTECWAVVAKSNKGAHLVASTLRETRGEAAEAYIDKLAPYYENPAKEFERRRERGQVALWKVKVERAP